MLPPSTDPFALLVASTTEYIPECFLGSAHFLFHGAAFGGISLLQLRRFPTSPVNTSAEMGVGEMAAPSISPTCMAGNPGRAAGFPEDGKLAADINGCVVEGAVMLVLQMLEKFSHRGEV